MGLRWCCFFLWSSLLASIFAAENPVANTKFGKVSGKYYTSTKGFAAQTFFGVPYAAPPVGDLRFKKPQNPTPWKGVKTAESFAPKCPQGLKMPFFLPSPAGESEDCLYVNVFAPKEKSSESNGYPVMVWIHGGGFVCGSAYDFGFEEAIDNLVSRGVVVVSVQYRLGVFGFLTTEDSSASGNWAIWDQLESLQWVQDNIKEFGGNPGKVTIFGESAGGASTSLLSYVSSDKNLFHQVISQSGAANAFWVTSPASILSSKEYARTLNCDKGDSAKTIACLRGKSAEEYANVLDEINKKQMAVGLVFNFGPMIDNVLYTKRTVELARTIPKRPTMLGVVAEESGMFLKPPPGLNIDMMAIKDDSKMTLAAFEQSLGIYVPPAFFPNSYEVGRRLAKFYYVDSFGGLAINNTYLVQQSIKVSSDLMFNVPAHQDLMTKISNGIDVWAYRWDFYGPKTFPKDWPWKFATHAWDMFYLFGLKEMQKRIGMEWTPEDQEMADTIGDLWTNFAKYGNPTPTPSGMQFKWPKYTAENPQVLVIDQPMKLSSSFHDASAALWTDLLPTVEKLMANQGQKTERKKSEL